MTRVLVLGAAGMLGHKLLQRLGGRFAVTGTVRDRQMPKELTPFAGGSRILTGVSLLDDSSLRSALSESRPTVVVNAVGVVKQLAGPEDDASVVETNALLPQRLARLGREFGFRLIHISTDCVFSGTAGPYDEASVPDPVDLYGRSKLLGELAGPGQLTLRTSFIGQELRSRHGLVEWFLGATGPVQGYAGALYSGLTSAVLSDVIARLIADAPTLDGLWHVSGEPISKYELLHLVRDAFGLATDVERNTRFHCDRRLDSRRFRAVLGWQPPSWTDMIRDLAAETRDYVGPSMAARGQDRRAG